MGQIGHGVTIEADQHDGVGQHGQELRPRIEAMDRGIAHRKTVDEVVVHGNETDP